MEEFDTHTEQNEALEKHEDMPVDEIQAADDVPVKKPEPKRCRVRTAVISSIACLLMGALLVLTFVPNALRMYISGNPLDKLTLIDSIINNNFIDADEVDKDTLVDMAAWGYVYGLGDQYSAYYDAATYTELLYSNSGGSHGIGITAVYYGEGGGIYIVRVTPGSPAETAGLFAGDIITEVDGNAVTQENYSDSINAIRGDSDTDVTLTVKRGEKTQKITATRGEFTVEAVYSRMIGKTGYIAITTFNEATPEQFKNNLEWVIDKGAKSLILDVRGNAGGLVDQTNEMLDLLLPEGEIGYAVYKDDKRVTLGKSDKNHIDLPIAVLTDGNTASSAEYFASALRDSADAVLVGETTFGKGIMQSTYGLGDGSALRVTVAKIYTASGYEYHGKGLNPDVKVGYTDDQAKTWFLLTDNEEPFIQAALKELS